MIFNAITTIMNARNSSRKKTSTNVSRNKYITEKYNERAIINRYFK